MSADLVQNENLPFGDPFGRRVRRWARRRDVRGVLLIWVVLTVLLCLFSFVPARIMGVPASPTKQAVENTMTVFTLAASPVAALVWAVAIYSVIGWRHRGSGPPTEDGPAMRSHGLDHGLWVGRSSVLCLFLLIWGLAATQRVASPATERPWWSTSPASSGSGPSPTPSRATSRPTSSTCRSTARRVHGDQRRRRSIPSGSCRWASRSTRTRG